MLLYMDTVCETAMQIPVGKQGLLQACSSSDEISDWITELLEYLVSSSGSAGAAIG